MPLTLATALAALALAANAPPVAVALMPATGSNVPPTQLAAAGDVLRAHLEGTGRFVVVRAGPSAASTEPTPAEAAAAAAASGASYAVVVHVARLAETAIVRLAAYAPDGSVVHTDQLGALGADDLDPALRRLAEGLARGGRARALAEIDTVTAREEAPLRKMQSYQAFGLRVGTLMPMRSPDPDDRTGGATGLGLVWHYDAREWLAEVALEAYTSNLDVDLPDPDRALTLGIGLYYPFSRGDVAPYAGVGLSYALARFADVSGSGLQARAMTGLLLGRLADVAVRAEVGWFLDTFPVSERGTGRDVRVHGALFSMTFVGSSPRRP